MKALAALGKIMTCFDTEKVSNYLRNTIFFINIQAKITHFPCPHGAPH